MTDGLIHARHLTKTFHSAGATTIGVKDASFELPRGAFIALMGPSGSGKTTILNLIAGWTRADSGEVGWDDRTDDLARATWASVAMVPQGLGLLNELSVKRNVELPLVLSGRPPEPERVATLLSSLGLGGLADRKPPEVSLGEAQRTAVARALVTAPELVLADEPAGHQDARWGHRVFEILKEHTRSGATCLVATHNDEVVDHADAIWRLRDGVLRTSD